MDAQEQTERAHTERAKTLLRELADVAQALAAGSPRAQAAGLMLSRDLGSLAAATAEAVGGEAEVPVYGAGTPAATRAALPAVVVHGEPPEGRLCYDPTRKEFALRVAGVTVRGAVGDVVPARAAGAGDAPRRAAKTRNAKTTCWTLDPSCRQRLFSEGLWGQG